MELQIIKIFKNKKLFYSKKYFLHYCKIKLDIFVLFFDNILNISNIMH